MGTHADYPADEGGAEQEADDSHTAEQEAGVGSEVDDWETADWDAVGHTVEQHTDCLHLCGGDDDFDPAPGPWAAVGEQQSLVTHHMHTPPATQRYLWLCFLCLVRGCSIGQTSLLKRFPKTYHQVQGSKCLMTAHDAHVISHRCCSASKYLRHAATTVFQYHT